MKDLCSCGKPDPVQGVGIGVLDNANIIFIRAPDLVFSPTSFEDYKAEFDKFRDVGMLLGLIVMSNVLNPNQIELETFSGFRKMLKGREEDLLAPDSEEDHPMIREIRRRTVEAIEEMDELGIL